MTIADATKFYLGDDPVHPSDMALYIRNLLYIREARWHVAVTLKKYRVEDIKFFEETLANNDDLFEVPEEIS
jgi:hypothetical protein